MTETMRFRLGIAYDGTDFRGWARQPGLRTVQGVLEDALAAILGRAGEPPLLTVAGRTDSGVHATGQVAHLDLDGAQVAALRPRRAAERDTPADTPAAALARKVNGLLGARSDVVVTSAEIAPPGFDARFSAVWRRYEYRVADATTTPDPLQRRRTLAVPRSLDLDRMRHAAAGLLGLGDFAAFCKPRDGATTIRTLQRFEWIRAQDGVLVAYLQADAFCHSMVRSLVGASIAVGEGRLEPEAMAGLLGATGRSAAFVVQPAHGLTLTEVGYPADDLLSARAEQTRARREHPEGTGPVQVAGAGEAG